MQTQPVKLMALTLLVPLAACGGGGDGTTNAAFPIDNPQNSVLSSSATMLSIKNDNINVELPKEPEFDFGSFSAASEVSAEGRRTLLTSSSENTFAAIVITPDDGLAVDLFAGRLTPTEDMPTGQADFRGDYVGAFTGSNLDNPSTPIVGTVNLNADFDALTLSGSITDRLARTEGEVDGGAVPEGTQYGINDLIFEDTLIATDGTFLGRVGYALEGQPSSPENGRYSGGFGGPDGDEVVGQIVINVPDDDGGVLYGEAGVFAAGH